MAIEGHFGLRGREFERSNLQKFVEWGGGWGMLKFRFDRRIIYAYIGVARIFQRGGLHCVKVRVLTRLSCRPPRLVFDF